MRKILFAFVIIFAAIASGCSGEHRDRRLIAVTGTSEVKVVPDEVQISLGVETLRKDLLLAKKTNDQSIKKMMEITKKYGVDPKDVQTSDISIDSQYDYPTGKGRVFAGYMVQNTMVVTLKDLSKFEGFLGDVLGVGANSLRGIYFQTSELQKYKAQARKLAIQAAKEKAQFLAGELGQKIGRPISITDEDNAWKYGVQYSNVMKNIAEKPVADSGLDLAPGQIVIRQSINVSFELK